MLQLFRLPPLHGVATTQLPQSLDECLRGLSDRVKKQLRGFLMTSRRHNSVSLTMCDLHSRDTRTELIIIRDLLDGVKIIVQ